MLERKEALYQMNHSKAPGPDGFSALFFKKCCHIVGTDHITQRILSMLNERKLEDGINETVIILVPKMKQVNSLNDCRPISFCNVVYKIISKILWNQLKLTLHEIVSEFQSAFIHGRLISDNFLLAHELSYFIRSRRNQKTSYLSLKTYMSKAYGRVEWDFLEVIQLNLGFQEWWAALIMNCVRSVSFQVKINQDLTEKFLPGRGLRQGDPLSPYLFIVCIEWLSRMMIQNMAHNNIDGIRICRGSPSISHLLFDDDSVFFLKAIVPNILNFKRIIDEYQFMSGRRINFSKSEVVFSHNVSSELREILLPLLGIQQVPAHSRYLGLPLSFVHNKSEMFKFLVERTMRKVMGWKEKMLFYAGKEVLIKSVLFAIPQYVMMCLESLYPYAKDLQVLS